MPSLEDAIQIAVRAHAGQKDKAGDPYILHPLRIMCRMKHETERIVAVLHDVVEDSSVTLDTLRAAGFSREIVLAVDCLTRRKGETYDLFVGRAAGNALSRTVKIADLEDNMDLRRISQITEEDLDRLQKYLINWRRLMNL